MMMACTSTAALTSTVLLLFVLPPEAVIWAFELYEAADFHILPPFNSVIWAFELYQADDFYILPAGNNICVHTRQGVRNKIRYALSTLSVVGQKPILVQFWSPKKAGNTFVLTTTHQPFDFYGRDEGLAAYRIGCLQHKLFVHREKDASFGLPGLAFKQGTPQQTANVHHVYYPKDERPPFVNEEIFSLIWGSLAVPVFLNNECVGVLEFVMTESKHSYDAEINEICEALKFAGLQSSTITETPKKTLKETEASEIIRRKTPSSAYARYNVLAPYFGGSKEDAMKKVAKEFNLYKNDGKISVSESTFTYDLRKVGITEWPYIRTEASESTPDTVLTSWDEGETSECLRVQTLNPITYASETQVYQPVYEASTVAHDFSDFDLGEWVNEWLGAPTQATNTFPPETDNNQPVYEASTVADDFFSFSWDQWVNNELLWEPTHATNTSPSETYNNQLAFGTSGLNSEFDGMKHQADADIDKEMVDIDELMDLSESYNGMIPQE